jgi:hypothetical protein
MQGGLASIPSHSIVLSRATRIFLYTWPDHRISAFPADVFVGALQPHSSVYASASLAVFRAKDFTGAPIFMLILLSRALPAKHITSALCVTTWLWCAYMRIIWVPPFQKNVCNHMALVCLHAHYLSFSFPKNCVQPHGSGVPISASFEFLLSKELCVTTWFWCTYAHHGNSPF